MGSPLFAKKPLLMARDGLVPQSFFGAVHEKFRTPWESTMLTCPLLMFSLPTENWWRLIARLLLGFVIYFTYERRHRVLARLRAGQKPPGTV